MKHTLLITLLILSAHLNYSHASGSAVGNGLSTNSILKGASLTKSKSPAQLCTDAGGKLEKVGEEEVCKVKDESIKMKDLIEAAKKNDAPKK